MHCKHVLHMCLCMHACIACMYAQTHSVLMRTHTPIHARMTDCSSGGPARANRHCPAERPTEYRRPRSSASSCSSNENERCVSRLPPSSLSSLSVEALWRMDLTAVINGALHSSSSVSSVAEPLRTIELDRFVPDLERRILGESARQEKRLQAL